ncbi:uncharacterized protein LOC124271833 [Haliotis rubra]|uniref:uncharacterized protein LOC124271833 n=1 Tax=Haliotis rubra TaxID=36100 RepID=UPI001EE57BBC|nr:uncharacterized protein LOC124271833 [Haliotis rubra]
MLLVPVHRNMTAPRNHELSKSCGGADGNSYQIPNDIVCAKTRIHNDHMDQVSVLKAIMEIKHKFSENMPLLADKLDMLVKSKDAEIQALKDTISRGEDTNRILNEQLYAYRVNEQKMRYEIKLQKNENKELGIKVMKYQSEIAAMTEHFRKLDVMTGKVDLVLQRTKPSSSAVVSLNNIGTKTGGAQGSENCFTPETTSVGQSVTHITRPQDCPRQNDGRHSRTQKLPVADIPSRNDTHAFQFGSVESHHFHAKESKPAIKEPNRDGQENIKTEQYVLSRVGGQASFDVVSTAVARYAASRGVRLIHVRHMRTWRCKAGQCTYTMLVDIARDDSQKVLARFWPEGVFCRLYVSEAKMKSKNENRSGDGDKKQQAVTST